jgi:hypothetical protein
VKLLLLLLSTVVPTKAYRYFKSVAPEYYLIIPRPSPNTSENASLNLAENGIPEVNEELIQNITPKQSKMWQKRGRTFVESVIDEL